MAANLVKFLDVTEVISRENVPETLRQLWCSKISDLAQQSDHGASIAVRIKSLHDGLKKTVAPKKAPSDSSTVLAPAAAIGSNAMARYSCGLNGYAWPCHRDSVLSVAHVIKMGTSSTRLPLMPPVPLMMLVTVLDVGWCM